MPASLVVGSFPLLRDHLGDLVVTVVDGYIHIDLGQRYRRRARVTRDSVVDFRFVWIRLLPLRNNRVAIHLLIDRAYPRTGLRLQQQQLGSIRNSGMAADGQFVLR